MSNQLSNYSPLHSCVENLNRHMVTAPGRHPGALRRALLIKNCMIRWYLHSAGIGEGQHPEKSLPVTFTSILGLSDQMVRIAKYSSRGLCT